MTRTTPLPLVAALAALLAAAPPPLPANAEAPRDLVQRGKVAFAAQCLRCHQSIDEAAGGYRRTPAWREVVADMVARGARLDAGEQEAVVEYVTGRMLLLAKCSSCHSANRVLTSAKSPEGWTATVASMIERMPSNLRPSAEQAGKIATFLAVERPAP